MADLKNCMNTENGKENVPTGIFHWYGFIQPFEDRIELIKKVGFDYVMLWWEDESYPGFTDRRKLNGIVSSYGLKLDNIHLPSDDINLLWSCDKSKREGQTAKIIGWLHECKESGADTAVMHTENGSGLELDLKYGFESFNEIIKSAENIKMRVSFENTRMFEYTEFVLKEFESEYAGFCYDSSHDFVNGQSCGKILDRWKHRLFSVHLSDNDGLCDRHWIPGKGIVNWNKVIGTIKETRCKVYSMEVYPYETEKNMAPIDFLIKARESLLTKLKENNGK